MTPAPGTPALIVYFLLYVGLIPVGGGGGGEGGTLIFSHIRRLGLFFGVQSYEFQYFLGFSEK